MGSMGRLPSNMPLEGDDSAVLGGFVTVVVQPGKSLVVWCRGTEAVRNRTRSVASGSIGKSSFSPRLEGPAVGPTIRPEAGV